MPRRFLMIRLCPDSGNRCWDQGSVLFPSSVLFSRSSHTSLFIERSFRSRLRRRFDYCNIHSQAFENDDYIDPACSIISNRPRRMMTRHSLKAGNGFEFGYKLYGWCCSSDETKKRIKTEATMTDVLRVSLEDEFMQVQWRQWINRIVVRTSRRTCLRSVDKWREQLIVFNEGGTKTW